MDVKFSTTSRPGSAQDVIQWVTAAENLGYYRVGIADSPALYRDPWVSLTVAALNSQSVSLGVWVTNPVTRHPLITASAAAALDEIAPGRFSIGIGTGNSGVYNTGHRASSVAALRDYVLTVRRLLEEGEAEYQGNAVRLPWAKRKIPIYIAAIAVKGLRLAGEIADGVIIGSGTSPDVVKGALGAVSEGVAESGRDTRDLDIWWNVAFNLYTDPQGVLDPQGGATREANYLGRYTLEGKFIPDRYKEGIRKLAAAYDITTHGRPTAEQLQHYDRLAKEYGVREYMYQRYRGITGTPDECVERIRNLAKLGVTQLNLNVPDLDRPQRLKQMKELVIDRL
jgi:5,10-methylenetetrahydromethanopterin reductase